MSNVGYGAATPPPGERWSVNMPVVVGAVFVFLLGVIIWVVASGGDDDGGLVATATSVTSTTATAGDTVAPSLPAVGGSTVVPSPTVPGTTTPAPMPGTSEVSDTLAPAPTTTAPAAPITAAPITAAPTTRAAPVPTTAAPTTATPTTGVTTTATPTSTIGADGDLGVEGTPISKPSCNDAYITVVASAIGEYASAAGIEAVLDDYPGSSYLRTDLTCPSLNPSVDGQPIYVVYFGPFNTAGEACAARSRGPDGAYPRQLSNELAPDHGVACD
jgi:cytoskeletal protein RodZ